MKAAQARKALVAVVALGGVLAAILVPGVMGAVAQHESLRARLENLQVAESRFRELVIALRHGLTSNYDEANGWMARIVTQRAELGREAAKVPELALAWQRYSQAIRDQETQWEDFKQRNAVVRNSLRYFQSDALKIVGLLPQSGVGGVDMHHEMMRLNNALFLQALGEGREAGELVRDTLERQWPMVVNLPKDVREEFDLLVRHALVISKHSPHLWADVNGLVHGDARQALAGLAGINQAMLIAEQTRTGRYRASLLAGLVFLAGLLALVVWRYLDNLRQSTREHCLAGTVFASSQQGIIVTDASGTIVRVNPAYCKITGYSEEELLGRTPRILQSGLQDSSFYREMWRSLVDTGHWQGELRNRRKNGDFYVQWINIDAVTASEGERLYVGIITDISELIQAREHLASLAYFDTLTGLPNRALFHDRLRQAMVHARREHAPLALIFCDLDNFKVVNDSLGHAAGDELLQKVAERLKSCVREADTVARLGGDEFAIILSDAKGAREMARMAEQIIKVLSAPCQIAGSEIISGASLGITFYPNDAATEEELLKNADVAMYRAKERGRNDYQFFTSEMAAAVAESLRVENGLRQALGAGELFLHYQPQICNDGKVVGAEALMRWNSPTLGRVPPSQFIPVAEKSGLIGPLGEFALREACRQCAHWRAVVQPDFRIAVNLSAVQFRNEGLADRVEAALHEFNLPGSALELEITESVLMEDVAWGQDILKRLKTLGCRLAIDDFGTGYSSLAYLRRFQVDVLKLDKSFVAGLGSHEPDGADDTAVAQAVISLARSLRLEVVAEGVETQAQRQCLVDLARESGFIAQGYLYSPALPADQFEAWLDQFALPLA